MNVLTASQMNELDRMTIDEGKPGIELMRAAGEAVSELLFELISEDESVAVVCGKGNNGGDGFRIAEILAQADVSVSVYLAGNTMDVRGDAKTCLNAYQATGRPLHEVVTLDDLASHEEGILAVGIIVDALFGTGLSGEVIGIPGSLIELMNEAEAPVVAVDIPSGVDASSGACNGRAVQAIHTVTFGCLKVGHVAKPGALRCGSVHVADIGFSAGVMASIEPYAQTLIPPEAAALMPRRSYDAHKYIARRVVIVAGAAGMTGAAMMTSLATLRSGAGMVILGCPVSLNDIFEVKLTEVMTHPLPEVRKKRCLSVRALGMLRQLANKADICAIGPGLGVYRETSELVRRFLAGHTGRVVLDADGINAFAGMASVLAESPADLVLTPHRGELARLMGTSSSEIAADPRQAAVDAALTTGKVVLLKGSPTIIATPSGQVWLNGTGNEGMATAGAGDVLTGLIAGLAAQGLSMTHAAVLGAFLHGRAGDIAVDENTVQGMIAGDMIECIPAALGEILALRET